jgi:hypothetical protein
VAVCMHGIMVNLILSLCVLVLIAIINAKLLGL